MRSTPFASIAGPPSGIQSHLETRFETLLPVQRLAVENGSTRPRPTRRERDGDGENARRRTRGRQPALNGDGKMLFLVPLVALANQKHEQFQDRYGDMVDVSLRVGASRIADEGRRFDPKPTSSSGPTRDRPRAPDRQGPRDIATVVIDEVHTLKEGERGHRLDGMISRLKHYCETREKQRIATARSGCICRRRSATPDCWPTTPGDAHRVRGATGPNRAPRHVRRRPREKRDR